MNLISEDSPHFHGSASTFKIMGAVCLALVPTLIAATWLYGLGARCWCWCASPPPW